MLEIINQRYMHLLFAISNKPRNVSELAKKSDLTLSVASTLISRWAKEKVLTKEKSESGRGNDLIIILTDYGNLQVSLLKKLYKNHKKNKKENNIKPEVQEENKNSIKSKKEVKHGGFGSQREADI